MKGDHAETATESQRQTRKGVDQPAVAVRVALLALLVVCGGLLTLSWRASRSGQVTLPDGTTVSIRAATFGKHHAHAAGGFVGQALGYLSRIPALSRFGFRPAPALRFDTTNDVATCWFQIQATSPYQRPVFQASVREPAGQAAARATAYRTLPLSTNEWLLAVTFENYPRSQKRLAVEIYSWKMESGSNWWRTHEFLVANRARRLPPAAQTALVTNQSCAGLTVTLDSLTEGRSLTNPPNKFALDSLPLSQARFSVRENGQPTTNWWPTQVEAWSASGNHFRRSGSTTTLRNGQIQFQFEEALWSKDTPWRMRFTFARIGGFDPTDLWTNNLPDVPGTMSAGLQETPIATSTDRHDCRVTLLKLTPASSPAGGVNLHYRLDHAREGVEVTPTRMTAENARQVGCRLSACSRGEVKRTYVFELDPGRIQSLQAVVAIHTNRIFEFTDRVHLIRQISPD